MTALQILALARGELGTAEQGPGNIKYNTAYYGHPVSGTGYSWCAVFLWWLFAKAGDPQLYYGGGKTAYAPTLLSWYAGRGQAVSGNYKPGDLIFFDFNGNGIADHVGLCESWDGTNVTTIDGNTSLSSQAAGGQVMRRKREKRYICGAARPAYEEEAELTQEQFNTMMEAYLTQRGQAQPNAWSQQARTWAADKGVLSGDSGGNLRFQSFCTREELVQMLYNLSRAPGAGA